MSITLVACNIGSGCAGAAVNGLVLLLLTPLVIRHLGPGDYGFWLLASAIGSHRMGRAARAAAETRFSLDRMTSELEGVYGAAAGAGLRIAAAPAALAGGRR